jgi:hypothetical protein
MELPRFLCVWKPVGGLIAMEVKTLAVGTLAAIDVTTATYSPTPPRPATTP